MTISDNRGWDVFAAAFTPLLIGTLHVTKLWRRQMREVHYYQPAEPTWETELVMHCDACDGDTFHTILKFAYEGATSECSECGDVNEYEGPE